MALAALGPIALAAGLGVGIHACAAAIDHAGEYRGPAACSVVDTAQLSALVPRLGGFRAEGVDDAITVDLSHRVTSTRGGTRTVHDSDRIGVSCTTTDVSFPDTTTTDVASTTDATNGTSDTNGTNGTNGTTVTGNRSAIASSAELLLLRQDRAVGIDRLVQIWQDSTASGASDPRHLGEPNMVSYQRDRTDGRPANCFAAEVVDAHPDTLLVSIDTSATGHCDMVITLLRAVASTLGPVVTSAPDTTIAS